MLNIIINEDLYDHDFVENWCTGFEELKERVQEYTLDKVSEITWIPKKKFLKRQGNTHQQTFNHPMGLATDQKPHGVQQGQCIAYLMALTGNLDVPGGNTIGPPPVMVVYVNEMEETLPEELLNKQLGIQEYPVVHQLLASCQVDVALDKIEAGYPIKMGWIKASNFLANAAVHPTDGIRRCRIWNSFSRPTTLLHQRFQHLPISSANGDLP
jgi:anaerobic selenocysteine-containing dehydrogenase